MLISFFNIWLPLEFFFCCIVSYPYSHLQLIKCCLIWFLHNLESTSVDTEKPEGEQGLMLPAFQNIPELDISIANLDTGEALILIRSGSPSVTSEEDLAPELVIHHFTRGTEEELVEIVNQLSENAEIWILGNDNAIGVGGLGIAACIIAESPNFTVRSLLFEDESLTLEAREQIVRSLRRIPSLLEQHLKYTRTGDVFVRRLVYHSTDAQPSPAPGVTIETPLINGQISAYFPPNIKSTDVQVSIDFFGIDSISARKPSVAFVGKVSHMGADVKDISTTSKVRQAFNTIIYAPNCIDPTERLSESPSIPSRILLC
jgi:hypothetical protein